MTDLALVLRKLGVLREFLARVERRRPADLADLEGDVDRQDALGLALVVAIQEAVDIAFHIAVDEGWGVPTTNREALQLLAAHGVIDPRLADRVGGLVVLRNRIARGYATVDVGRVWRELPAGIAALAEYADAVTRYVMR